jgi:hypothetical protein
MKTLLWPFAFLPFTMSVVAQGTLIVVPGDRATLVGNAKVIDPFRAQGTIDTVYGSGNFSNPVLINAISFRLDEGSLSQSYDVAIPRVVVRMTTYSGNFASFKTGGYDLNKGADDRLLFDGPIHWTTTDLPSGVNPFDLRITFSTPFSYDPANGALLFDYTSFGPFSGGIPGVDAHGHGDSNIGWLGDKSLDNLVTQFDVTIIPEVSIHWLIVFGGLILYLGRKKHEYC